MQKYKNYKIIVCGKDSIPLSTTPKYDLSLKENYEIFMSHLLSFDNIEGTKY